jgi:L-asparaginase
VRADRRRARLEALAASLELRGVEIYRIQLMNKDSLDMSEEDHVLISQVAGEEAARHDGVIVVHGTDRLAVTGERMVARWGTPAAPIVLTGAMRPYELRDSDALQNLTEALMAVQLLPCGVYVVMHSQVLQFPGVIKDPVRGSFIKPSS